MPINKPGVIKEIAVAVSYSRLFHILSIIFDVTSVTYFFFTFFWLEAPFIGFEIFLGAYFLCEYIILFLASDNHLKYIRQPLAVSNSLIIVGYLAAPFWNLGFLRILRVFRIVQMYQLIPDVRVITNKLIIWEKAFALFVHVCVLVFIISEVVYILQVNINSDISTRFDAFYFTVNAITKVGDGDQIALAGAQGKVLTLFVAFLSLSIFVQLLDTVQDVQKINLARKKGKHDEDMDHELEEIYLEQYCTYCDIKNREKMRKEKKIGL